MAVKHQHCETCDARSTVLSAFFHTRVQRLVWLCPRCFGLARLMGWPEIHNTQRAQVSDD